MRNDADKIPPPGANGDMAQVVYRNIHALLKVRRENERHKTPEERVADTVTRFAGSMKSVYLHAAFFGGWLLLNLGVIPGVRPWDPFPFVMLAMIASVEAIFLTSFVLVSQNRLQEIDERRAELNLQISLLAEHEVTRLIQMTDALCQKMGVHFSPADVEELKQDVQPEVVLEQIEEAQNFIDEAPR